ncbi:hypothetical protein KGO95_04390 [Patescibacteria group bacterium]|nr:hypothetical protein [Patescibacteria group bacterium]
MDAMEAVRMAAYLITVLWYLEIGIIVLYAAGGLAVLTYLNTMLWRLEDSEARWKYLSILVNGKRMDQADLTYALFRSHYEKKMPVLFGEGLFHWFASVALSLIMLFLGQIMVIGTLGDISLFPERFSWKQRVLWPLTARAIAHDIRSRTARHIEHTDTVRAKLKASRPA